jgi:hypothetical protein
MKFACGIWFALISLIHGVGLDFPTTLKEIHAPADSKTVTADFTFTNNSDKAVVVAKYDSTCSCMAVTIKNGKLRYASGESGVVRTEFSMGNFSGTVDKVVALWLDQDSADKPSLVLTVRVHIPVLVALEPKTLKWDLNGKAEPKTIQITMHHEKPIRVIAVNASTEAFKHEIKTIDAGKSYALIVTPTATQVPSLCIFRIETDCNLEKHRIQQVFATVRRSSAIAPGGKP